MHPLRKIVVARALALALVTLALWQHQSASADAEIAEASAPWLAPLDRPLHLVNPYFQPNSDFSAGHRGVDYRVELDQTIYAPIDATIWFVGKVADRELISARTKAGDLIEFEPACSQFAPGQQVLAQRLREAAPQRVGQWLAIDGPELGAWTPELGQAPFPDAGHQAGPLAWRAHGWDAGLPRPLARKDRQPRSQCQPLVPPPKGANQTR